MAKLYQNPGGDDGRYVVDSKAGWNFGEPQLVFLSIDWIIFYISTIPRNASAVLSPPLIRFLPLCAATFLLLLVLFWRHNQSSYKRRYSQWERSFLCKRCGSLTVEE